MGSLMLMGAIPPVVGLRTVVFPCCAFAAFETAVTFAFAFAFALDVMFDATGIGSTAGGVSENHVNGFQTEPPLFFVFCDLRILYLTRTFTCDHE